MSDKHDSLNKRTQEISELMKLHIQGVWQNAHKFITQLAHYSEILESRSATHLSSYQTVMLTSNF